MPFTLKVMNQETDFGGTLRDLAELNHLGANTPRVEQVVSGENGEEEQRNGDRNHKPSGDADIGQANHGGRPG